MDVKLIQTLLNKWLLPPKYTPLVVDGILGPKTHNAIIIFQSNQSLVPDGIVGPLTMKALTHSVPPLLQPFVKGIDVSHYQGNIDWQKVKSAGFEFASIKCTEGETWTDPTFQFNWAEAKKAGIARSAYHFFHTSEDPFIQANHFLTILGPDFGELPCALDWEDHKSATPAQELKSALIWLHFVDMATLLKPFVYSYTSYINELGNPQALLSYPLWLADTFVQKPTIPLPWTDYVLWQSLGNSSIPVPGITVLNNDFDLFKGALNDLKMIERKNV